LNASIKNIIAEALYISIEVAQVSL